MREIKFRALRKDNNIFVYGDVVQHDGIIDIHNQKENDTKHKTFPFFEILPETVGQYTGLKDKNEKEVFEADIVDYFYKDIAIRGEVKFGKVSWCIHYKTKEGFNRLSRINVKADIEIIGNIYKNPELITNK